ncbi:S8 family peptidase [Flavivirga spongiicola]|uniref:S8 family serine peptidase n=1 Tax=Flavivirga spongiicola TaxID=421621 RepID=A0ABU7XWP6_9FLAO|nr:S8 family serine peptidase [Flavivirga sp. MEBiC05379]MDO5979993.1 S8 family serine peptidase [Flavivirga sp. MEBiC05379]
MKKPILGKQTFLKENNERISSYEKFVKEVYENTNDQKPLYTGRYLVTLDEGKSFSKIRKTFKNKLGFKMASTNDFKDEAINESKLKNADALIYEHLGIALIDGDEDQIQILESESNDFIIEPEKIVYVPDDIPSIMNISSTWGISATETMNSSYTGKDIKVAVLDTGFDLQHPDFIGRNINSNSFVNNQTVQDRHGHGTHCIGTACGDSDMHGQRYGVAKDSIIYAGKVLSNQGSGAQSWILNGINWAVNNGCKVVSMSLGSNVFPGQGYDQAYERIAKHALSKGSILVAAAGNDSRRSRNIFNPVNSPANCPSILSVAAIDMNFNVADFSNRSINPNQQIDIASAGVMVYSSWPVPMRYRTISGTSMATPHVAGILALLWEKTPNATPYQIINELRILAKRLPLLNIDVGSGLSIAP